MNTWVVAAEPFTLKKGQKASSITQGIGETIPKSILEHLNRYFIRNLSADEEIERERRDLRQKRQSLFLQLSSEYQKRDALFLSYSDKKLQKKVEEQNKKIKEVEDKIDENLRLMKEAEEKENQLLNKTEESKTEEKKKNNLSSFFKNIIRNDKAVIKTEEIKIYKEKSDILYIPSVEAKKQGYEGPLFNEEMCENKINSYITGVCSVYGNYISATVDIYLYPGASKIGTITEIGSLNDLEGLSSAIVTQIVPLLTNSMPVVLNFSLKYAPKDSESNATSVGDLKNVKIYIDDILQKNIQDPFVLEAGVHSFQIIKEGYKDVSTSYFFEGDTEYDIEIFLEEKNEGNVFIDFTNLENPLFGDIYINGVLTPKVSETRSKVVINGTNVLGEFITEDGMSDFFYIPENLYYNDNIVSIKPNVRDKDEYINTRRKWMYGSYSAFMISLIPMFITKGVFANQKKLYFDGLTDYKTAYGWQTATNVFAGVSIGLGIFWGFELVRYLLAANSVLPRKAKEADLLELENVLNYNKNSGSLETDDSKLQADKSEN